MGQEKWLDKPYYSLDAYMKYTYGQKVYKIAVDAGLTCPNRDGTLASRGCIFCSAGGSGEFAVSLTETDGVDRNEKQSYEHRSASTEVYHREYARRGCMEHTERKTLEVRRQIARGMAKFHKKVGERFVIYFQAYTNTYGNPEYLEQIWRAALEENCVVGISIATRPDCLGDEITELLRRLHLEYEEKGKFIWVELGLQTMQERTATYIRRGYCLEVYETAIRTLTECGIPYITHVILGLPGETTADMLETVRYVCCRTQNRPFGIKLQLLHVLRNTDLCSEYEKGVFSVLEMEEYIELVIRCLEEIPEDIVIHRVTGDGPKKILVAPLWSGNKRQVLNTLHQKMKIEKREQGTRAK